MLFVRIKHSKDLRLAKENVKYIAFRSREGPRGAFDKNTDHADINVFNKSLDDDLISNPNALKVYRIIVSLSGEEYQKAGIDYKDFIRETLSNYESYTGKKLTWIAAEHMEETHPHVHISIKAAYEDRMGNKQQFKLSKPEFEEFRYFFTYNYEKTVNKNLKFAKFLENEKEDIIRKLAKNAPRYLLRGNSMLYSIYGIYSLIKLTINREHIKKARKFRKWVRKSTYGSHKYMDFSNILKTRQPWHSPGFITVNYFDRSYITNFLNSQNLKWVAGEKEYGTMIKLYPYDNKGYIIAPEKIREISYGLTRGRER